jgi:hypothetical protein
MAFGKKGYRRLVVDGRILYWLYACQDPLFRFSLGGSIRANPNDRPYIDHLIVRPEEEPSRMLRVTFGTDCPLVTPRIVRACVEEAIRRGWLTEHPHMLLQRAHIPGFATSGKLLLPRANSQTTTLTIQTEPGKAGANDGAANG